MRNNLYFLAMCINFLPVFNELHCPSCEKIHCSPRTLTRLSCKGGVTTGICNCCPKCAKIEGEKCGGDYNYLGKCDSGLYCQINKHFPKYIDLFTKRKPEGHCKIIPAQVQDEPIVTTVKCRPKCTPKFCLTHPKAICSAINVAEITQECQKPCQHTSCKACRFLREPKCRKCKKDDFKCMKRYGRCIKRDYCTKQKFPCRTKKLKREENGKFQCWIAECLS